MAIGSGKRFQCLTEQISGAGVGRTEPLGVFDIDQFHLARSAIGSPSGLFEVVNFERPNFEHLTYSVPCRHRDSRLFPSGVCLPPSEDRFTVLELARLLVRLESRCPIHGKRLAGVQLPVFSQCS